MCRSSEKRAFSVPRRHGRWQSLGLVTGTKVAKNPSLQFALVSILVEKGSAAELYLSSCPSLYTTKQRKVFDIAALARRPEIARCYSRFFFSRCVSGIAAVPPRT